MHGEDKHVRRLQHRLARAEADVAVLEDRRHLHDQKAFGWRRTLHLMVADARLRTASRRLRRLRAAGAHLLADTEPARND